MQTLTLSNRLRRLWGSKGSLRRHIAGAAVGTAALAISSKLLMLFTSVVLARWMGAERYGTYATAMALSLLLTVPTGLGLPVLVIRLLASYRVDQQWGLMRGLLTLGNRAVLSTSLVTSGVAAVFIWALIDRLGAEKAITYGFALILIPLTALGAMRSAALRGLHHVILGQLPENLIMPGIFLALTAGWWIAQGDSAALTPHCVILARITATAVAFTVGAIMLRRRTPETVRRANPEYMPRSWARAAFPLLFIAGINIINMQIDILMLAAMRGSESAGIYQAATRGAELVAFSLAIVNMAIQPTIARLYAAGDMARLQKLTTLSARAATAAALPLAAAMILWGDSIMTTVFGSEFTRGAIALAILSAAQLVNAFTGPANSLLNMTGHEDDQLKAMTVGVAINAALNALLIPRWDIVGAAIATGTSLIVWNILLVRMVRNQLGLNATASGNSQNLIY